jgi:hypothetical protein
MFGNVRETWHFYVINSKLFKSIVTFIPLLISDTHVQL